jgi:hypothetical protein
MTVWKRIPRRMVAFNMNCRKSHFTIMAVGAVESAAIAAILLAACSPAAAVSTGAPAVTADEYRATPEGDFPVAGICASFKEKKILLAIRAWPDNVPDPRCIAVRADQNLIIRNSAPEAIAFRLGKFRATVEPGESFSIEAAFGEYLLPGAHSLHIEPYGGPEIYFESTK